MGDVLMKRCTGPCGRELPATVEYFSRHKLGKYGLRARCKECCSKANATYRREHLEEALAKDANSRSRNQEKRRIYNRQYYAENREKELARKAGYSQQHPEHVEKMRLYMREYRRTERGKQAKAVSSHNRRVRSETGVKLTTADIPLILKAHTDKRGRLRCANPNCPHPGHIIKSGQKYHLDHFIPLIKGGTNDPGNFRVMHDTCNLKKNAKHPFEIGMLI